MSHLSSLLQLPRLRLFVVSACSSKKANGYLDKKQQLTADDLDNPSRRKTGEARLVEYRRPAAEMYKGNGHSFVINAVQVLREHGYLVSHYILSAGYGLLRDSDEIVPYDVTFKGHSPTWIRERGQRLRLRTRLIEIAQRHNAVILILGREYLEAIGLPLPIDELPQTLAYTAPSFVRCVGQEVMVISVGRKEQRRIGTYSSSAKERMFQADVESALRTRSQL